MNRQTDVIEVVLVDKIVLRKRQHGCGVLWFKNF